jgi:hypothetical protein
MENLDLDTFFLAVIGREQAAVLMIMVDTLCAGVMFYIAVSVSRSFGFGNFEQRLQAAHRFALLFISLSLAWHAYDISRNPQAHGLTPGNLILHVAMVVGFMLSALRLRRAVRNEDNVKRLRQLGNGGAATGPFPVH